VSLAPPTSRPLREATIAATLVTAAVTLLSAVLPPAYVGSGVAAVFLGVTWALVFRRDDGAVLRAGVSFGGVVLAEPIDGRRLVRETTAALGWALVLAVVFFGPFYVGFRLYAHYVWHATRAVTPTFAALPALNEVVGQVALIALPEEVFYRGYLQTTLDDAWPGRIRVLGAEVGLAVPITSAVFAMGHLLTIHDPARLAVFFPSLVFGWLRERTGGVGASIAFHAACNLLSATLLSAYGPH
jgi:uncharacterized protein